MLLLKLDEKLSFVILHAVRHLNHVRPLTDSQIAISCRRQAWLLRILLIFFQCILGWLPRLQILLDQLAQFLNLIVELLDAVVIV